MIRIGLVLTVVLEFRIGMDKPDTSGAGGGMRKFVGNDAGQLRFVLNTGKKPGREKDPAIGRTLGADAAVSD